jgi:hypothetical protein
MRVNIYRALVIAGLALVVIAGCGKNGSSPSSSMSTKDQIQASLTETITRWHYGDKGGLYDNEFQYIKDRFNFDEYLKFGELGLDADTVDGITVEKVNMLGQDTAIVDVDVIFKGPTGKISHMKDRYPMFLQQGRWIRPTLGMVPQQIEYEKSRRAADSAADAEAKELEGK